MGEIAERGFQKRLGWTQKLMIRIEQAEASLERRNRSSSKTKEEKEKSRYQKHELYIGKFGHRKYTL